MLGGDHSMLWSFNNERVRKIQRSSAIPDNEIWSLTFYDAVRIPFCRAQDAKC